MKKRGSKIVALMLAMTMAAYRVFIRDLTYGHSFCFII